MAADSHAPSPDLAMYRGCLLGGAVGDALGAPVEFLGGEAIRAQHGPEGVRDMAPAFGRVGAITDDTQMTLFTAEGMLRAHVRGRMRGITTYTGVTARAYLRWLQTQGVAPDALSRAAEEPDGWLIGHDDLFHRRAPGSTCLQALAARTEPDQQAANDSKGCGGVMRVAPVGLYHGRHERTGPDALSEAFQTGMEIAGLTHGHPTGKLAAGALAALVAGLGRGLGLPSALRTTKGQLRGYADHREALAALEQAEGLAEARPDDPEALPELGQGWVAEEALAIGLYATLSTPDLETAVIRAVSHGGDSDSTGAIAGNLAGSLHGAESIPERWLGPLELREVIEAMADDLWTFPEWGIGEYGDPTANDYYWQRYPGA